MKIKVLKKGTKKVARGSDPCPWLLEVPPEAGR